MRTVDLFSGCGGFSLGFQNAGFQIGNAVPVNLAKFVGQALMNYINNA